MISLHFLSDGPKNTSVSVRPSMEVDAGTNVTLICSSHANPPVESYIWFKIDDDDDDIVDVGHQPVLFSGDGGQYLCSASNKHGSHNSSVVTVKIKGKLIHSSCPSAVAESGSERSLEGTSSYFIHWDTFAAFFFFIKV